MADRSLGGRHGGAPPGTTPPALLPPDGPGRVGGPRRRQEALSRAHQLRLLPDADRYARRRVRFSLIRLEETLAFGLRFDFAPDTELAMMRAHARNVMFVIGQSVESALRPDLKPTLLAGHVRHANDLVLELTSILDRLGPCVLEAEAALSDDSWSETWAGRLLGLAAALLPADRRRSFMEDQCGNLAQAESRREWIAYLAGILLHMPAIAAATLAAARRDRGRPAA
jgi:hypothetical protein